MQKNPENSLIINSNSVGHETSVENGDSIGSIYLDKAGATVKLNVDHSNKGNHEQINLSPFKEGSKVDDSLLEEFQYWDPNEF